MSVILIGSVSKMGKNYHPEVFLEECKYVVKEKRIVKYIIGNIEIYSDSDRKNFDEENSGKENFNEKILMKETLTKKILMKKNKKYSYNEVNF